MAYQRISRSRKRELEEPDEFITISSRIVGYITGNTKQILLGVATVIVIIAVFSGLRYYGIQTEKTAQALLTQTLEKYETQKKEATPQNIFLAVKPEFENLLEKYPGKDASKIARLIYADICLNAGEEDTANALYRQSLKDYKGDTIYYGLVRKNLAFAYEAQKQYEQAILQLQKVLEEPDVKMKDELLFTLGRLYAANGQKDKETENLETVIAEFPDSDYAKLAREILNF